MTTAYQPPRTNGLGIAGFIISLVGLVFTLGFLCPIGLLLSFIALFRAPRGFAVAGFILGLIGSIIVGIFLVLLFFFGMAMFSMFTMGWPAVATLGGIEEANRKIVSYEAAHAGALPTDVDGDKVIAPAQDGWGHTLHFRRKGSGYEIRSAGQDGILDTPDDIFKSYAGNGVEPH
jgi:hypothetical protein